MISDSGDARRLFLKPENLQPIGAFKLRGAYNKIASLSPEERERGVIAYSSGNHAQGVAYAARALRCKAVIVMPGNAPAIKLEATAALGAEIVQGRRRAARSGNRRRRNWRPSTGTPSCRPITTKRSSPDKARWDWRFSKIARGRNRAGAGRRRRNDQRGGRGDQIEQAVVKVIGVEPALAADAQASLRAGKVVNLRCRDEVTRTIADGLRTQSIGAINFEHIRKFVDDIVTVSEDEIREAMRRLAANPQTVAEPSGAVAVAGFLFRAKGIASWDDPCGRHQRGKY